MRDGDKFGNVVRCGMRVKTAQAARDATTAVPPHDIRVLIVPIASGPPDVVLNEAIIAPIADRGWP